MGVQLTASTINSLGRTFSGEWLPVDKQHLKICVKEGMAPELAVALYNRLRVNNELEWINDGVLIGALKRHNIEILGDGTLQLNDGMSAVAGHCDRGAVHGDDLHGITPEIAGMLLAEGLLSSVDAAQLRRIRDGDSEAGRRGVIPVSEEPSFAPRIGSGADALETKGEEAPVERSFEDEHLIRFSFRQEIERNDGEIKAGSLSEGRARTILRSELFSKENRDKLLLAARFDSDVHSEPAISNNALKAGVATMALGGVYSGVMGAAVAPMLAIGAGAYLAVRQPENAAVVVRDMTRGVKNVAKVCYGIAQKVFSGCRRAHGVIRTF